MSDVPSHRLPPQSLEGEMSVLGGVLLENEALNKALEILRPDDFYR
ncbi:MAG TPA: DnaB-like helicase N-terminal domain-containing protein, partial [Desulfuromonadales bacterium]